MKFSRRHLRLVSLIAAAPLLLGGAAGCGRGSRTAPANRPAVTASVTARPAEQVEIWRRQVARDPFGATGWSNLGHALVSLARAAADESIYLDAEKAFRRSLELRPRDNSSARGGLARTLMARHQFKTGLAEAELALEESPWDGWLLGLTGDAAIELGDYARARQDYDELLQREDGPAARARQAQLAELCGDRRKALAEYEKAATQYPTDALEERAWLACQMGDLKLRAGALGDAYRHYERALTLAPNYAVAQQRMADYYEWSDRPAEARPLLEEAVQHTRTPEVLERLAAVDEKLGRTGAADSLRAEARAHMEHHYLAGDYGHVRTLARILMDRPAGPADRFRALELARLDCSERGGVYAQWVLARALRLNDRPAEALAHIEQAVRLGTPEADFYLEKAAILTELGRAKEAGQARGEAHRINPRAELRFQLEPRPAAATPPYFSGK